MTALVARCPHCGQQHPKEVKTCPKTGEAMPGTLALGDLLNGRYRVLRYVCEGGLGAMYEADAGEGRRVMVEVAHPDLANDGDALGAFYDSARAGAASPAHTGQVVDAGRAGDGSPYLVLEPLEGQTLAARLENMGNKMPWPRAAHIVRQILEALGPLHRAGVAHRSLAPEHIFLIERDGDPDFVKVLDFGFAELVGVDAAKRTAATAMGYPLPHYLAPEQTRQPQTDHRVDIWACGVLLYRMTTGHVPFQGRDVATVLQSVYAGRFHPPRSLAQDMPAELEQTIQYCLAIDPGNRYQSAEHLAQTLGAFARPETVEKAGRERTLRPTREPFETQPPVAAQMDEITPKPPSKAAPIGVGLGLAVAVLFTLLAVRGGGGKATQEPVAEVKTAEPTDKPTDKPPDTPTDKPADKPGEPVAAVTPPTDKPAEPPPKAETPDAAPAAAKAEPPDAAPAVVKAAAPDAAPAVVKASPPDAGAAAVKPKMAVLSFNVKPRDAKITVHGKPVSGGKAELPSGGKPVKVSVSAPGYLAYEEEMVIKGDDSVEVELKKEATATAKPPTDKPPTDKPPVKKPPKKKPPIDL